MAAPKVFVTISHRAPGIQPPMYVAGTFSNPEWVPQPMEYTFGDDRVHTFTKTLEVPPSSEIQYKFRVGEGDWWILDENSPVATDGSGNRNNVLVTPELPQPTELPEAVEAPEETQHATEEPSFETKAESTEELPKEPSEEPAEEPAEKPAKSVQEGFDSTPDEQEGATKNIQPDSHLPEPKAPSADTEVMAQSDPSEPAVDNISNEPVPVSRIETLKQSEQADRKMSSTPEIAAEVADSAALLDRSTPEPEALAQTHEQAEDDLPSTIPIADIADKAAEADIAAEVADTAETLDADEPENVQSEAEPAPEAHEQTSAEVAAEVADTAEALDTEEPKAQHEATPPAYQSLADFKADTKDDSLDIAGYSNDAEPVPLFAHECAGLYEDDEIPGEDDVEEASKLNGRLFGQTNDDFDDPTLEKFPSTKGEIMSTVRKVGTGLNEDQTQVEGIPLSPVANARRSSVPDARGDLSDSDSSSTTRSQQSLSLPPPLTQQSASERSVSVTSLQSIAEDESEPEEETEKPIIEKASTADKIAPIVEQAETADEVATVAKEAEGDKVNEATPATDYVRATTREEPQTDEAVPQAEEAEDEGTQPSLKPTLQSLVTVPSPSVKPSTDLLSPISADDEAIALKNGKGKEKTTDDGQSGYLTPERAATPKPEEPGSPREPAPNTSDPVAELDLDSDALKADSTPALSEPRSPQIVVSREDENLPDEELLPAASLSGDHLAKEAEPPEESQSREADSAPSASEAAPVVEAPRDDDAPEAVDAPEVIDAPEVVDAARDVEASESSKNAPSNGSEATSSNTETAVASSALEGNQSGLKKRSVGKPNPAERTDTPISITGSHREAAKSGNWFSAFFRLIFIDIVGGFVSRLCGGRRKTLVTTVAVLVAVGVYAYQRMGESGFAANR